MAQPWMARDESAASERRADKLLAASEAFLAELDSGGDFAAWEAAKKRLREAVAEMKGLTPA